MKNLLERPISENPEFFSKLPSPKIVEAVTVEQNVEKGSVIVGSGPGDEGVATVAEEARIP